MSAQIRQERKAYYDILEATQKGQLEVTAWLNGSSNAQAGHRLTQRTILASVS